MSYNKLKNTSLSFNQGIGLLVFYGSLLWAIKPNFDSFIQPMFFLTLYVLISLTSENLKGIEELVSQIWNVNERKNMDDWEKISIIQTAIEHTVEQWWKFWVVITGDKPKTGTKTVKGIYKGSISIFQYFWILGYFIYTVIIETNSFAISLPINIMLQAIFFTILEISAGDVKGIGEFVKKIYEEVKTADEKKANKHIKIVETLLKQLCHKYYFIQKVIESQSVSAEITQAQPKAKTV